MNALHMACKSGDKEIVESLLARKNVDLNHPKMVFFFFFFFFFRLLISLSGRI